MRRNILVYATFLLLVVVGHWLSNALTVYFAAATAGLTCGADAVALRCAFGDDVAYSPSAYAGLTTFLAATMLFVAIKHRHSLILPFTMLFGGLGLFASAYDFVAGAGVLDHVAMVNGAFNALGLGLSASLLLVPLLIARKGLNLLGLGAASIVTFSAKIGALALFARVEPLFHGAMEVWLLYFVFLFGVFSIHVAAISMAFGLRNDHRPALPESSAARTV